MTDEKAILTQLSDQVLQRIPSDTLSNTATPQFSEFIENLRKGGISEDELKAIIRAYNYFNVQMGKIQGVALDKPLTREDSKERDSKERDSKDKERGSRFRDTENDSMERPDSESETETPQITTESNSDEEMAQLLLDLVTLEESKAPE